MNLWMDLLIILSPGVIALGGGLLLVWISGQMERIGK